MINIFEQINIMLLNAGVDFIKKMFIAAQSIYNPTFWTAILTCYFLFIAFKFLKMEVDLKQILTFVFFLLSVVIVLSITHNEKTFSLFVEIIKLPSKAIEDFVAQMLDNVTQDSDPSTIIGNLQEALSQVGSRIDIDSTILHYLILFVYWALSMILIVAVIFCTLISSFMSNFTLGLGIIILPCVFFKVTSSMFFNWLRSYLFFTTLPPASLLMLTFVIQINKYISNIGYGKLQNLNEVGTIIVAEIIGLVGIWLLVALLNQIIGSQNPTSALGGGIIGGIVGASSALGITKMITKARDGLAEKSLSYAKSSASSAGRGVSDLTKQTLSKILSSQQDHSNPNVPSYNILLWYVRKMFDIAPDILQLTGSFPGKNPNCTFGCRKQCTSFQRIDCHFYPGTSGGVGFLSGQDKCSQRRWNPWGSAAAWAVFSAAP